MLYWNKVVPELRAILAFSLAMVCIIPVFILAPADDWRVAFLALIGGAITAVVCWQHFSGWDIFTAGAIFAVAGAFHDISPQDWTFQACLVLPAVLFWYLGTRLAEEFVVFPSGYDEERGDIGAERLLKEWRKGTVVTLGLIFSSALIFIPLAEAMAPLALPVSAGLSFIACSRWHIRRPIWPIAAFLLVLPAVGFIRQELSSLLQVCPPVMADPWFLGGTLTVGAVLGVWIARWRYSAKLYEAWLAHRE